MSKYVIKNGSQVKAIVRGFVRGVSSPLSVFGERSHVSRRAVAPATLATIWKDVGTYLEAGIREEQKSQDVRK